MVLIFGCLFPQNQSEGSYFAMFLFAGFYLYSVFEHLQDGWKQSVAFMAYDLAILMMSQFQNCLRLSKCCNSENIDDIKDALSGIMANDLKFPSTNPVEKIRQ